MSAKSAQKLLGLTWERRIEHIDRPMKRRSQRFVAAALRKAWHRRCRGLPSRDIPMHLAFLKLDLLRATKTPSRLLSSEVDALRRRYAQALVRSRMLEHKHLALAKVQARRVRVTDTSINLWCRRQKWLSMSKSDEVTPAPDA